MRMEESYICCRVLVRDFADYYFTLSYLSDDETIRRDDFVIVPCGRNSCPREALPRGKAPVPVRENEIHSF